MTRQVPQGQLRAQAIYVGKAAARRLVWAPSDLLRHLRRDGLELPPRGLSFVGRSDFEQTGAEFLEHFKELGGLAPTHRVLDVGCGIGRMAIPLTGYLRGGSYEGFDVGREMIRWCQRHVTPRHPDFRFTWVPIYNRKYNPFGSISASEFRFPYDDDSFDFALATSLFTHLTPADAKHYLAELGRVLRPGARSLLTFFLITEESAQQMQAGRAAFQFQRGSDGALTIDPRLPEEAVAFSLEEVGQMLGEAGLSVVEPIHHGDWAGAAGARSFQDIVVARARAI
jgi:ubiquinone/menaquinone biosynthesis C-methylase UbiE